MTFSIWNLNIKLQRYTSESVSRNGFNTALFFIVSVVLQKLPPWISFYINQRCGSFWLDNVVDTIKIRKTPNFIINAYNFASLKDFKRLNYILITIGLRNQLFLILGIPVFLSFAYVTGCVGLTYTEPCATSTNCFSFFSPSNPVFIYLYIQKYSCNKIWRIFHFK